MGAAAATGRAPPIRNCSVTVAAVFSAAHLSAFGQTAAARSLYCSFSIYTVTGSACHTGLCRHIQIRFSPTFSRGNVRAGRAAASAFCSSIRAAALSNRAVAHGRGSRAGITV